jgi:hypothetical protein
MVSDVHKKKPGRWEAVISAPEEMDIDLFLLWGVACGASACTYVRRPQFAGMRG